ncbi:MAG: chalcone isomerase family protein [Hylemonella sp.]|nr:chalcone isomerase family protein [Hylemonella sp.]MDH5708466.1 chalcone isomerase family protein [Hylemonella sp.]
MRFRWVGLVLVAGLVAGHAAATNVDSLQVSEVSYPRSIDLAGQSLRLNGAGTRYKAIFQVYAAGLYLRSKAASTEEVLRLDGAKRISLTMLREIDAEEMGLLFIKGIKANTPNEDYGAIVGSVLRMSQVFSSYKRLKRGDTVTIDWLPGQGAVIRVRGEQAGDPFVEPAFYAAMLRIWLGQDPADDRLKQALLGLAD